MDSSQVRVLEQGHEVSLSGLLKRHHSRRLETQVGLHSRAEYQHSNHVDKNTSLATHLEVLSNLTNETLEWQFTDEEFRGLLIPTNLAESDGTRTESVGFLHTTSGSLMGIVENQHVTLMTTTTKVSIQKRKYVRRWQSCEQLWLRVAYEGPCL